MNICCWCDKNNGRNGNYKRVGAWDEEHYEYADDDVSENSEDIKTFIWIKNNDEGGIGDYNSNNEVEMIEWLWIWKIYDNGHDKAENNIEMSMMTKFRSWWQYNIIKPISL